MNKVGFAAEQVLIYQRSYWQICTYNVLWILPTYRLHLPEFISGAISNICYVLSTTNIVFDVR